MCRKATVFAATVLALSLAVYLLGGDDKAPIVDGRTADVVSATVVEETQIAAIQVENVAPSSSPPIEEQEPADYLVYADPVIDDVPATEETTQENLGNIFIKTFGGFGSRFTSMVDGRILDEGVVEPWASESMDIVQENVSKHFATILESSEAAECLETICYVDLNTKVDAAELSVIWRNFQSEWTGEPTLSDTTVLLRRSAAYYRLYFFAKDFKLSSG